MVITGFFVLCIGAETIDCPEEQYSKVAVYYTVTLSIAAIPMGL